MRFIVALVSVTTVAACSGSSSGTTSSGACVSSAQTCSLSAPCCTGYVCSPALGICLSAGGGNTEGGNGTTATTVSSSNGSSGSQSATSSSASSGTSSSTSSSSSSSGTTTTATSSSSGSSGTSPDGGSIAPVCPLTQSGNLDVDIETVVITGTITVNHLAPPSGLGSTYIAFGGEQGWSLDQGATYSVRVLAGTYDISVMSGDSALTSFNDGTGQSQSAVILHQQALTQSGSLDLDIETVQVSGNVTVNQAVPPSGLQRTSLTFNGQQLEQTFGSTYSATLLAGTYDVGVETSDFALTSFNADNGESQSATLLSHQTLTQSGALNVDVESVQVSGNVTVNQAAPPSGLQRTSLTFNGQQLEQAFGSTYSATLLAGTYDVGVETSDAALTSFNADNGESQSVTLLSHQTLTQSGALNVDVETVQVSGNVTVNQAAPPSGLQRTSLTFNGQQLEQAFGSTYSATLLAGTYDVGVETSDAALTSFNADNGESQSATLLSHQTLTQSGALNVDVETVQVSGNVTVNQAAPPSGLQRTSLTFNGQQLEQTFGSTYSVTLLAGIYDVGVETSDSALTSFNANNGQSQSATLLSHQTLTQSGALNVDVETVQLSGNVTVNHAAPPSGLQRTALTFGGQQLEQTFGSTYSVTLLAGDYPIGVYTSDAALTSLSDGQSADLPICP